MLDRVYVPPGGAENFPVYAPDSASASATSTSVTAAYTNRLNSPYYLTNVGITCLGGAAQFPTRWSVELQRADGTTLARIAGGEFTSTTAALANTTGFACNGILLPPRYLLVAVGIFNAGANANVVVMYPVGFYLPRGNIGFP